MYLTGKQVVVALLIPLIVGSILVYACIKMINTDEIKSVSPNNHGQYSVEIYSRLPEWIAKNPEKRIECMAGRDGRICIVYRIEQNK